MKINKYLDSTYLKLPSQSGLSFDETYQKVLDLTKEAIDNDFCLVMIRPEYVKKIRQILDENKSNIGVGTVIGFHQGTDSLQEKLTQATKAIEDGVDDLDFVINYEAFKKGDFNLIKDEFLEGTSLALKNSKVVKWIIEIAALSNEQIKDICAYLSGLAKENFEELDFSKIYIKSSTGFYQTKNNKPNGATFQAIDIMLEYSAPLQVKAAGGVRNRQEAEKMIKMGVGRIGTSSAKNLL